MHGGILARRGPAGRSRVGRRAPHHADRSRRREPLSVRQGRVESGHAVRSADRGDRHRRSEPGPRGGQELRGRPRRRLAGRLPGGARAARSERRARAEFRFDLARKAFAHTGRYDTAIAATLETISAGPRRRSRGARRRCCRPELPDRSAQGPRSPVRRESAPAGGALRGLRRSHGFAVLQGKELSYTNLLDLDAAARIVREFSEPAAVVIKHTNPCGAATGTEPPMPTCARATPMRSPPSAASSGSTGRSTRRRRGRSSRPSSRRSWRRPSTRTPAPSSRRRPNMRVVVPRRPAADGRASDRGRGTRDPLDRRRRARADARRRARGARALARGDGLKVVTRRQPTAEEWQALRFAWRICAHVKSNTVMFAAADRTLAIGAGQMSRVDAVNVARMKAGSLGANALAGSVAASDAFFPFRDGLDAVAAGGRDRRRPAGRIGARSGSDCRGRRARPRHGVHRAAALPPLIPRAAGQDHAELRAGGAMTKTLFAVNSGDRAGGRSASVAQGAGARRRPRRRRRADGDQAGQAGPLHGDRVRRQQHRARHRPGRHPRRHEEPRRRAVQRSRGADQDGDESAGEATSSSRTCTRITPATSAGS